MDIKTETYVAKRPTQGLVNWTVSVVPKVSPFSYETQQNCFLTCQSPVA